MGASGDKGYQGGKGRHGNQGNTGDPLGSLDTYIFAKNSNPTFQISSGESIPYNAIVSSNISLSGSTFTIRTAGIYLISYDVKTQNTFSLSIHLINNDLDVVVTGSRIIFGLQHYSGFLSYNRVFLANLSANRYSIIIATEDDDPSNILGGINGAQILITRIA